MSLPLICVLFTLAVSFCHTEELVKDADYLDKNYGKVIFSSVLFRHGDRTVDNPYPNDPYPLTYWVDGKMQLTKVGKEHEYLLGEWFRQRYANLLQGKRYRYDLLRMNSSDTDRTLMSAELFLAGMFPPSESEMWNSENLRWQPIPVHTLPQSCDNIIAQDAPCEKYELEKKLVNDSPDFAAFYREHQELFEYVAKHSGITVSIDDVAESLHGMWNVYDDLFVEDSFNLTLPKWTDKVYPQPLKSVAEYYFTSIAFSSEMQKLKGGPLLKAIIDDMITKKDDRTWNTTFHFYSGHDSTVSVLLNTLGVFNGLAPPYSTAVIIELRQMIDDYVVTVLYKNSSTVDPYLLEIPKCSSPCTLDNFVEVTKPMVPIDWNQECDIGFLMRLYYNTYLDIIVLICISVLLVGLVLVIIKLHCARNRRYKHYRTIADSVLNHYNNSSE